MGMRPLIQRRGKTFGDLPWWKPNVVRTGEMKKERTLTFVETGGEKVTKIWVIIAGQTVGQRMQWVEVQGK
jgi:hypothetical protein